MRLAAVPPARNCWLHMRGGPAIFVSVLALALAAAAAAQDACLSGASTLGDQRALTALETAIAADCPCGALSRQRYERCAHGDLVKAV
jgi:hypothetical protein